RDVLAVEEVMPACGLVQTAEDIHRRRLPGSGCPHYRNELTTIDVKRDCAQRVYFNIAHLINLVDVIQGDERWADQRISGDVGFSDNLGLHESLPSFSSSRARPCDTCKTRARFRIKASQAV